MPIFLSTGSQGVMTPFFTTSVCAQGQGLSWVLSTTTPAPFQRANFTCAPLAKNSPIFQCQNPSARFSCVLGVDVGGDIFILNPVDRVNWMWFSGTVDALATDCSNRQQGYMTQGGMWTERETPKTLLGQYAFGQGLAFTISNMVYSKCVKSS